MVDANALEPIITARLQSFPLGHLVRESDEMKVGMVNKKYYVI